MNAKFVIAGIVLALAASASADPFTSVIDFPSPGIFIDEGDTYTYEHDLATAVPPLVIPPDEVTWAKLKLTFCDDECIDFLSKEFAYVSLDDGEQTWGWKEVDSGTYRIKLDTELLNDDGILKVAVTIDDNCLGWFLDCFNGADVYLCRSEVYGEYVPLPGAVLLGVLGLAAAGRKLRGLC